MEGPHTCSWLGPAGGLPTGLLLSQPTSPAPAAAANKALGSWQGTLPVPRAPHAACQLSPQAPQLQAPERGWHCPKGRGVPPHPHPSTALPTTLLRVPGAPLFSGAKVGPEYIQPGPKEAPQPAQSRACSGSGALPQPQVGEFINFLSKGLQLFNCWNEKVSHETQHLALPTKRMETLQPSRPQLESKAGVLSA